MINSEIEEWRPITGYTGIYEVSNLGRVKSLAREVEYISHNQYSKFITTRKYKEKILQPRKLPTGYLRVQLQNIDQYIHRIVAREFLGSVDNKEINHIDGNKANNRLSNLEITDRIGNQNHAYDTGLNKRFEKAISFSINGKIYNSLGEASRDIGIIRSYLSEILKSGKKEVIGRKYTLLNIFIIKDTS